MTVTNLNYCPDDPGVARVTDTSGTRDHGHMLTREPGGAIVPLMGAMCVSSVELQTIHPFSLSWRRSLLVLSQLRHYAKQGIK